MLSLHKSAAEVQHPTRARSIFLPRTLRLLQPIDCPSQIHEQSSTDTPLVPRSFLKDRFQSIPRITFARHRPTRSSKKPRQYHTALRQTRPSLIHERTGHAMAPDKDKNKGGLRGTKSSYTLASPSADNGLLTVRYEQALPAKPPIPVTVAPPRSPPTDLHPALRRPKSAVETDLSKRDSGLAPTTSSKAREGSVRTVDTIDENALGVKIDFDSNNQSASPPQTSVPNTPKPARFDSMGSSSTSTSRWRKPGSRKGSTSKKAPKTPESPAQEEFSPITTDIPTESLLDEDFLKSLSFSKRGSMMLGGQKAVNSHARINGGRRYVWQICREGRLLTKSGNPVSLC